MALDPQSLEKKMVAWIEHVLLEIEATPANTKTFSKRSENVSCYVLKTFDKNVFKTSICGPFLRI